MYFNDEYNDSLTVFKQHLNADKTFYPLALHATDIVTSDYPVSRELYDKYSENLRKAVDAVFYKEEDSDLALRLKANATRFGAFKAYNATQDIRREGRENSLTDAEWTEKRYNSFQAAEYNTAVARSRTAKQFEEFMDKDRMEALPNLKWLPSTSAEVRETHRVFWNRIWAKTDPFWSKNQPGNLWNCKCDWHETDDPVTDGNPQTETAALGLDGNPAITGKIFSDKASYVARVKSISNETVRTQIYRDLGGIYYKDTKSRIEISALADINEVADNIRTARILDNGGETVKLRPDYRLLIDCPNPEYEINGEIADAKRILKPNGITAGFSKAIKQGVSVVVIDYGNGEYRTLPDGTKIKIHYDDRATAKAISDRYEDFENGIIKKCYVILKGRYIEVDALLFTTYPGKSKENRSERVKMIMRYLALLPTI